MPQSAHFTSVFSTSTTETESESEIVVSNIDSISMFDQIEKEQLLHDIYGSTLEEKIKS